MRWTVHGERSLYESFWVNLRLVDVEIPDGPRFEHHVVRIPAPAGGCVVYDPSRGVLLLWRHRFITDTWGWEIPAGRVDEGETPKQAAGRETIEEAGWSVDTLTHMTTYNPCNGVVDQQFHLYLGTGPTHLGEPTDTSESEFVAWVTVDQLRADIQAGKVPDGLSLTALLWALNFNHIS